MPKGTCQVCGCTEDNACEGGCSWWDPAQMHCSQCVTWVQLRPPCQFLGILPYDLAPVRSEMPHPFQHPATGKITFAFTLDVRRVDPDALDAIVIKSACGSGALIDELREAVAEDPMCIGIFIESVACAFQAEDLEIAAENALAVRETGQPLAGNSSVQVTVGHVQFAGNPSMGGERR